MPTQLDRHDRRMLSEDFSSVQAATSEVRRFFSEIMNPSDEATVEDVAETLLVPAKGDCQTLRRAVDRFGDAVRSFEHYGDAAFDLKARDAALGRTVEVLQTLETTIDRALVAQRLDGSSVKVLTEAAPQMESMCRALVMFAEQVCAVFGVATRTTIATSNDPSLVPMMSLEDDDADSSFDSDDSPGDDENELMVSGTTAFIDDSAETEDWRAAMFTQ